MARNELVGAPRGETTPAQYEEYGDDLGLSIDMLDVDRLRDWARLLLTHGPDIGHWGSVTHVAGKMQMIATGIEKAIRDIGTLRAQRVPPSAETTAPRHDSDGHVWISSTSEPGFYQCARCGMFLRDVPRRHRHDCARCVREDDAVIASMCGSYVYNPNVACTCDAPRCDGSAAPAVAQERDPQ